MTAGGDAVERALYAFEASFHPSFTLTGTCSLPYIHIENRSFYLCLYKHILYAAIFSLELFIRYTSRKGCWQTAFEQSKLLLSLDTNDPIGMLLIIDFFAIKSGNFKWILSFYEHFNTELSLSQMPNWAYSIALAEFHASEFKDTSTSNKKNNALNKLQVLS